MKDEFDKEFDRFMDGNSEVSRLYSLSKTSGVDEHIADKIIKSAKSKSTTSEKSWEKPVSKNKYYLPFAIAASILLTFGLFINLDFSNNNETTTVAALEAETVTDIAAESLSYKATNQSEKAGGVNNQQAQQLPEGIDAIGKNKKDSDTFLATVNKKETLTPVAVDNRKSETRKNDLIIARKEASSNEQKPDLETSIEKDLEKSVSEDSVKENQNYLAKTDVMEQPVESAENEDSNYSMDWMNRLSSNAPAEIQVTKQVSNTLSEEVWIKKILNLHENKSYEEAAKNVREFRKLYPRYKLPEVLRNAYEKP